MSNIIEFTAERLDARALLTAGWLENGSLDIYTEPRPLVSGAALTTQTLLVTMAMPAALAVSGGVITGSMVGDTIAASGIAAWGRFRDSGGFSIADADVGTDGSSEAIQIASTLSLTAGYAMEPVSFALAEG